MPLDSTMIAALSQAFPKMRELKDPAALKMFDHLEEKRFPANMTIVHQGDVCEQHMLIVSGTVKVFTRTENGREIVLYRVTAGECCVLTTSCLLGHTPFPVEGMAETDIVAVAIPAHYFSESLEESRQFRDFVFSSYTQRVSEMIGLIGQIASVRIDRRLADYLLEHCEKTNNLQITHDHIAKELGSVREVISRNLKDFSKKGWVELSRGNINIINRDGLIDFTKKSVM